MYVVADVEWIEKRKGPADLTQLAAVRVDDKWNIVDSFSCFIRPRDGEKHKWNHVAYTGGTVTDFLHAPYMHSVLNQFMFWLKEDEIILWWHSNARSVFKSAAKRLMKTSVGHPMCCLNEYVYAYLRDEDSAYGSAYFIAEARGIDTNPKQKHNALNDVLVICKLMQHIDFQQEDLKKPLIKVDEQSKKNNHCAALPYQYDKESNMLHSKGCLQVSGKETQGYSSLEKILGKNMRICDCCKQDYRQVLKENNKALLEQIEYTYIYAKDATVFHKYNCSSMLSAKKIEGTCDFKEATKGRRPCKHCHPTAKDLPNPLSLKPVLCDEENMATKDLKALRRHKVAQQEREEKLKNKDLSSVEKADVLTLTQSHVAFWSGQGYETFHLRSCPKLKQVSNLRGFSTYNEAIRAGYTPCRKCKPSPKHDVKVSVPTGNRVRENESAADLLAMCKDAAYSCSSDESCLYIETPVGKWKLHIRTRPVEVEHINLVMTPNTEEYHKQHRLFLSLLDTFDYIKRHDDTWAERKENVLWKGKRLWK